jgi:hypothetical protein
MSICPSHPVPPEWVSQKKMVNKKKKHYAWRGSIEKIIIFFFFKNRALGAQNNGTCALSITCENLN